MYPQGNTIRAFRYLYYLRNFWSWDSNEYGTQFIIHANLCLKMAKIKTLSFPESPRLAREGTETQNPTGIMI
jgi:hypothetical protein